MPQCTQTRWGCLWCAPPGTSCCWAADHLLVLALRMQLWVIRVNSRGLRMLPWGEPVLRVMTLEVFWPTCTDCGLSVRSLAARCIGGCWSPGALACLPDAVECWYLTLSLSPGATSKYECFSPPDVQGSSEEWWRWHPQWSGLASRKTGRGKTWQGAWGDVLLYQPFKALNHNRSECDGLVVIEWCDLRFLWHWDDGGSFETWWDFGVIQWGVENVH